MTCVQTTVLVSPPTGLPCLVTLGQTGSHGTILDYMAGRLPGRVAKLIWAKKKAKKNNSMRAHYAHHLLPPFGAFLLLRHISLELRRLRATCCSPTRAARRVKQHDAYRQAQRANTSRKRRVRLPAAAHAPRSCNAITRISRT